MDFSLASFVHNIDPVIGRLGGFYLWWYGFAYCLGFLAVHLWLRHQRDQLQLSLAQVYQFSILFAAGVLIGGRIVEVVMYEWPFYRQHPHLIPAYWLGGMATHGLLLGATAGTWIFCRLNGRSFLRMADVLVIPGALLMGLGRLGNFVDGQIVGGATSVWWAVQFPDADGFRHPVVLYDGLKNLLIVPLLLWLRTRNVRPGILLAHFIFWYGFLRIFVDLFREYPGTLLGLATGQNFNIAMSLAGLTLMFICSRRSSPEDSPAAPEGRAAPVSWPLRAGFAFLLLFPLVIPSDWTQDIPSRYGPRHPQLQYSVLYPPLRIGE